MANFNDIKRRVDNEKQIMIEDMDETALRNFIHKSCRNYYVDFMNDNVKDFNATVSILDYIKKNAEYDNVDDFINYSMLIAINSLLNSLMDRKMDLILPDAVGLTADGNDEDNPVVVNLLERVKLKRNELKELQVSQGCLMGRLLKRDADADRIAANINILEDILSDEAMGILKKYVEDGG